ncbi:MAG: hypothetical protein ACRC0B_02970 [Legionella sp.]
MDVVINSECIQLPKHSVALETQGCALLNYLTCLGYTHNQMPLAALLAQSRALDGDWVVLSPVFWQASHNNAVIVATGDSLELSEDESRYWFELFSKVFAVGGDRTYFYDAHTWLFSGANMPGLYARPAVQLINQPIMPELSQLGDSMYWPKMFTEGQMFFAAHADESIINGLWAWGGGDIVLSSKRVVADESFLAIARLSAIDVIAYNPSISLQACDILLIDSIDVLSNEHKKILSKAKCYWRNRAYVNSSWLTRFWRSLFHAN